MDEKIIKQKEYQKAYGKKYREEHKDYWETYLKEYKNVRKEDVRKYNKHYYLLQRDKRFNCECGGHYLFSGKSLHMKTKKHINFISAQ